MKNLNISFRRIFMMGLLIQPIMMHAFTQICAIALNTAALHAQNSIPTRPNLLDSGGLRQGEWCIWYDEEEKETKNSYEASYYRLVSYHQGKPIGAVKEYYRSGKLRWEGQLCINIFEEETFTGPFTQYYEHGQIEVQGTNKTEPYISDRKEKGKIVMKGTFCLDKGLDGKYRRYYIDGTVQAEENYVEGNYQGIQRYYDKKGRIFRMNSHTQEKNETECKRYREDGRLLWEHLHRKNKLVKPTSYLSNGSAISSTWHELTYEADQLYEQEKYAKALVLYERALKLADAYKQEYFYAELIQDYYLCKEEITNDYLLDWRIKEASIVEKEANNSIYFAEICENLADAFEEKGKTQEAIDWYDKASKAYLESLGPKHHDYAMCLYNLAKAYEQMKKYSTADSLYTESLRILTSLLGEDHSTCRKIRSEYTAVYHNKVWNKIDQMTSNDSALILFLGYADSDHESGTNSTTLTNNMTLLPVYQNQFSRAAYDSMSFSSIKQFRIMPTNNLKQKNGKIVISIARGARLLYSDSLCLENNFKQITLENYTVFNTSRKEILRPVDRIVFEYVKNDNKPSTKKSDNSLVYVLYFKE